METLATFLDRGQSKTYAVSDKVKHVLSEDRCKQFIRDVMNRDYYDCINVVTHLNDDCDDEITVGADHLITTTLMMMAMVNNMNHKKDVHGYCPTLFHMYLAWSYKDEGETIRVYRLNLNDDNDSFYYDQLAINEVEYVYDMDDEDSAIVKAYRVFADWFKSLKIKEQFNAASNLLYYLDRTNVYVTEVLDEEDAMILYNKVK